MRTYTAYSIAVGIVWAISGTIVGSALARGGAADTSAAHGVC